MEKGVFIVILIILFLSVIAVAVLIGIQLRENETSPDDDSDEQEIQNNESDEQDVLEDCSYYIYNCDDFECESSLKEKLTEIANKYPEFVYVAPYPAMSKKIAITRMRKIQTFDNLDTNALISFIEDK